MAGTLDQRAYYVQVERGRPKRHQRKKPARMEKLFHLSRGSGAVWVVGPGLGANDGGLAWPGGRCPGQGAGRWAGGGLVVWEGL